MTPPLHGPELSLRPHARPHGVRLGAGLALCALALCLGSSTKARAGGLELLPGGTKSVARAGAVAARPSDPMALQHNPAGLAWLSGRQLMANLDVPWNDLCVQPYGYYGWGVYEEADTRFGNTTELELSADGEPVPGASYASDHLDRVCNSASVLPVPHLAIAAKLAPRLYFGAGLVGATMLVGLQWGGANGSIVTPDGPRPTPTRYQLVKQEVNFALNPTAGLAYRIRPDFSLGVALQILMADVDTYAVQSLEAGTSPHNDVMGKLSARDYFVPALTLAAHAKPIPALDVMAAVRLVDDLDGSGEATFTTSAYNGGAERGLIPTENDPIDLERVKLGFPWTITAGIRYAGRSEAQLLEGEPDARDAMESELWDVELDLSLQLNARASQTLFEFGQDVSLRFDNADGTSEPSVTLREQDLERVGVDRHLRDAFVARLGGSYSLIPKRLMAHAGVFYESSGVDPDYANIDAFAFQRFGAGLGVALRFGAFDLIAAYGRIQQPRVVVAPRDHQLVQDSGGDPRSGFDQRVGGIGSTDSGVVFSDPAVPGQGQQDGQAAYQQIAPVSTDNRPRAVVNAGEYTGAFDIVSLGVVYRL
ncbi:MAG: hypothetical protein OEZ06_09455 [Myxococcales bacterium]|nr:hypothetical protein [Myxococcales bacterium]